MASVSAHSLCLVHTFVDVCLLDTDLLDLELGSNRFLVRNGEHASLRVTHLL